MWGGLLARLAGLTLDHPCHRRRRLHRLPYLARPAGPRRAGGRGEQSERLLRRAPEGGAAGPAARPSGLRVPQATSGMSAVAIRPPRISGPVGLSVSLVEGTGFRATFNDLPPYSLDNGSAGITGWYRCTRAP